MNDDAADAIEQLRILTACRCAPPWTDRGRHETHCVSEYREDVETLAAELEKPR